MLPSHIKFIWTAWVALCAKRIKWIILPLRIRYWREVILISRKTQSSHKCSLWLLLSLSRSLFFFTRIGSLLLIIDRCKLMIILLVKEDYLQDLLTTPNLSFAQTMSPLTECFSLDAMQIQRVFYHRERFIFCFKQT